MGRGGQVGQDGFTGVFGRRRGPGTLDEGLRRIRDAHATIERVARDDDSLILTRHRGTDEPIAFTYVGQIDPMRSYLAQAWDLEEAPSERVSADRDIEDAGEVLFVALRRASGLLWDWDRVGLGDVGVTVHSQRLRLVISRR